MGQNSSWQAHQQFLGEYQLQARNPDLNLTYLIHRDTRQHCLLRELSFADPKDFQAAQKQLQRRLHQLHPSAISLIRMESMEEESMCSKLYRVCALWEHSSITLADEVNRRALQRIPFEGRQLLQILRALVGGLLHYCALGTAYEGLTTRSVLVGWGGFKLADPLMGGTLRNLEVVHGHRKVKNVYLSPEECRAVQLEENQQWHPSDAVFTAGIIALEAALLQRQDGCYLQQSSKVNWQTVGSNLQRVKQRYGGQLRGVIAGMLQGELCNRTDPRQLWEMLEVLFDGKRENAIEERMGRPQFSNRPLEVGGISVSQVTNRSKPTPTYYSNQGLRLSTVDSMYSPQRLFETTHPRTRPIEQEVKPIAKQRPLPLLQMKTINTTTDISQQVPQVPPPLFSFERQLNTSPFIRTPREVSNQRNSQGSSDSTDIVLRKYEHHTSSAQRGQRGYFVEEFKLGSRYQGFKQGGRREGWGKFHFQDGGLYEGEWHQNKMHGYGRLYYQSGKLAYEGQWVCDQFSGMGKLYNQSYSVLKEPYDYCNLAGAEQFWVYYEGQFMGDMKQGEGVLQLANGEYFKGHFQRDEANGQGEYSCLGGRRVQGQWRRGKLQGVGESRLDR